MSLTTELSNNYQYVVQAKQIYREKSLMSTIFFRRRFPAIVILSLWCAGLIAQPRPETIPGKFVVKIRPTISIPESFSGAKTGIQSLDNALKSFPIRQVKRFCPKHPGNDPLGIVPSAGTDLGPEY